MVSLEVAAGPFRFSRETFLGISLAVFVSLNAVLVLCYGLVGISGNSIFTGALLTATTASIIILGDSSKLTLRPSDLLFFGLICCILASSLINRRSVEFKEIVLFALSLSAYPAFRLVSFTRPGVREAFVLLTGGIVALGTIFTTYAIIAQWGGPYLKPFVLGVSDAGANFFLMVCGFLIIAVITTGLDLRKSLLLSASIFLPIAVFSASQVRMTFIAIVGVLLLATLLSETKQRKYFAIVIAVILTGMAIGAASRYSATQKMLAYAVEETKDRRDLREAPTPHIRPASCGMDVNLRNSIAIRKALLLDALYLVPQAGLFGFGLGGFAKISCMSMDVHNSYLQAIVEFGWIGGLCFCLAILIAAMRLLRPFRTSGEARFALCSLVYLATLSLAHGVLSDDKLLFAMMGLAADINGRRASD
jgi:O-antigen ligase